MAVHDANRKWDVALAHDGGERIHLLLAHVFTNERDVLVLFFEMSDRAWLMPARNDIREQLSGACGRFLIPIACVFLAKKNTVQNCSSITH